jgi:hypothetical protein
MAEESSVSPHPSDVIRRRQSSLDHKERGPAALLEKNNIRWRDYSSSWENQEKK